MFLFFAFLLACETDKPLYEQICTGNDASCCALTSCDISVQLDGEQGIDMVLISVEQEPLGRYSLRQDFYMMTTEVTQGMFYQVMKYNSFDGYYASSGHGADYPAYFVNWHMAADFANKLTAYHNSKYGSTLQNCYQCSSSGFPRVSCEESIDPYQCSGYRLPTDAEWEFAARSGTASAFWTGEGPEKGGAYSFDICSSSVLIEDDSQNPRLSDYAWFCYTNSSQPVGQLLPNGFGLYDMHGNIWEWTADWFGCSFPVDAQDPFCASVATTRVGRGGAYSIFPSYTQASGRYFADPARRDSSIGFRLVRNDKQNDKQ